MVLFNYFSLNWLIASSVISYIYKEIKSFIAEKYGENENGYH